MLICDKILKIAEVKNDFAIHFPTLESYTAFMKGTYPEAIIERMWKKFGAETCVYVLDQTEKEGLPLTRVLQTRAFMEKLGLDICKTFFVESFADACLAQFNRADRVNINDKVTDKSLSGRPAIITGLKAVWRSNSWEYKVTPTGDTKEYLLTEGQLSLNKDHDANKPESEFLNQDAGKVRKPAGPKKPVKVDNTYDPGDDFS